MNHVTHIIVSDDGLMGSVYKNVNPFIDGAYVISSGGLFYTATTLDRAVSCAIRNMPTGATLVVWQ